MKTQAEEIRAFLIDNIEKHPSDIVTVTMQHFGVTRTTVHRHLKKLRQDNQIVQSGTTRDIKYFLSSSLERSMSYAITHTINEFDVYEKDFSNIYEKLPKTILDIVTYGFTEIFNNAIDHSRGSKINVSTDYSNNNISISISDDGIGVFKNLQDYFKLDDLRESVLQLNKGKMTTDPANHTGEGVFFSSRVFDVFEIYANNLHYIRDNIEEDWSLETLSKMDKGTCVKMLISPDSLNNLVGTFQQYQDSESLAFDRTDIVVGLSKFGNEVLISRSQAKRITLGLEKFRHITLDFSGIRLAGQGFVDEIFRVFSKAHPGIKINYINANSDVEFMIKRSLSTHL